VVGQNHSLLGTLDALTATTMLTIFFLIAVILSATSSFGISLRLGEG
jgi:hypothetical protein